MEKQRIVLTKPELELDLRKWALEQAIQTVALVPRYSGTEPADIADAYIQWVKGETK